MRDCIRTCTGNPAIDRSADIPDPAGNQCAFCGVFDLVKPRGQSGFCLDACSQRETQAGCKPECCVIDCSGFYVMMDKY